MAHSILMGEHRRALAMGNFVTLFGGLQRRPSKRRKTQKVGQIQRVQQPLTKTTISEVPQTVDPCWKELAVETYTPTALEVKNVVVVEMLLGTIPGATLAAFGPNNHVGILCYSCKLNRD